MVLLEKLVMFTNVKVRRAPCSSSGPLHTVHGVVRHLSKSWHLSWYAGRGQHPADVRGRVHVFAVFHLVCRALPVDVEAGDAWVGGQDIPLKLQGGKKDQGLVCLFLLSTQFKVTDRSG